MQLPNKMVGHNFARTESWDGERERDDFRTRGRIARSPGWFQSHLALKGFLELNLQRISSSGTARKLESVPERIVVPAGIEMTLARLPICDWILVWMNSKFGKLLLFRLNGKRGV